LTRVCAIGRALVSRGRLRVPASLNRRADNVRTPATDPKIRTRHGEAATPEEMVSAQLRQLNEGQIQDVSC